MTEQTCSRCGATLSEPIPSNANYVTHDDFTELEPVDAHYALKHTEKTKQTVEEHLSTIDHNRDFQAVAAEMAHPEAPDTRVVSVGKERRENDDGTFVETVKKKEVDFSIPVDEFDKQEVETPERIKDDDVAIVQTTQEERPVQKTALVCLDCTKSDDEIIWGVDE